MAGEIPQIRRERALHQFEAIVQVVFEGPGRRFIEGEGVDHGLLLIVHQLTIEADPVCLVLLRVSLGWQGAAGTEQQAGSQGQGAGSESGHHLSLESSA
ncbi:hypothetical protein D3C79_550790 [compost metagenome]